MRGSKLLRAWREKRGWNQTELANALGMNAGRISEYEAGKKQPRVDAALDIAKATRGAVPVASWRRSPAGDEASS